MARVSIDLWPDGGIKPNSSDEHENLLSFLCNFQIRVLDTSSTSVARRLEKFSSPLFPSFLYRLSMIIKKYMKKKMYHVNNCCLGDGMDVILKFSLRSFLDSNICAVCSNNICSPLARLCVASTRREWNKRNWKINWKKSEMKLKIHVEKINELERARKDDREWKVTWTSFFLFESQHSSTIHEIWPLYGE